MFRTRKRSSIRGFTFIELFITLAVFSLLSLAVYATFASGLRVWNRVNETSLSRRKILLFSERFAQEARQILNYPKIGLSAKNNEVRFPTLIQNEIAKVAYFLDDDKLVRQEETLSGALGAEGPGPKSKVVANDIEELNFSFAYQETGKEGYLWTQTWEQKDILPLIIKLRVKAENAEPFEKTVIIPLG